MRIFGLDFTSAPAALGARGQRAKRLTLVEGWLGGRTLRIAEFRLLNRASPGDFGPFEAWLRSPGPWVAGIDFPFAQPLGFVEAVGWPTTDWLSLVDHVRRLGLAEFAATVATFRAGQPAGQKHRLRPVDVWARSISPMMLHGVPVGRMFWQGAPRLADSPASIADLRPVVGESRTVVEAYPGLLARRFLGRRSYKNDDPARATEAHRQARADLIAALRGPGLTDAYGLGLDLPARLADQAIGDPTGDQLDSVVCALQAAWAWLRDFRWVVPAGVTVDPREGWIADPGPSPPPGSVASLASTDRDPPPTPRKRHPGR